MSRPLVDPNTLQSGMEAWDAVLRDMVAAVFSAPFPVVSYPALVDLPSASLFEGCLARVEATDNLYFSKGGVWREVSLV